MGETDRPIRQPVETGPVDVVRRWRYAETVLAIVVAANVAQLGARLVISPVVPDIIATFETSKGVLGLALTGMWVAYALFQFPGGVLSSRFGEKRVLLTAMTLVALGSVLLSRSPSFLAFGVFALMLGAGGGLFFPAAGSLLSRLYENTGQALGTLTAGAAIAGLVAPIVAAAAGVRFGWRVVPLLGAGAAATAWVLLFVRTRQTEPERPGLSIRTELRPGRRQLDILGRPPVAFSIAVTVAGSFAFQAFTSFFPTFLIEFRGFSTEQAGLAFGAMFLLSATAQPLVGRASDTIGRDGAIGGMMFTTAVGFAVVIAAPVFTAILVAFALIGVGMSWFGALNARFMDALREGERGIGFGLIRTVALLLGAPGSVVTGYLADTAGWVPAFGLVAGLLVTSCTLLALNAVFDAGL